MKVLSKFYKRFVIMIGITTIAFGVSNIENFQWIDWIMLVYVIIACTTIWTGMDVEKEEE